MAQGVHETTLSAAARVAAAHEPCYGRLVTHHPTAAAREARQTGGDGHGGSVWDGTATVRHAGGESKRDDSGRDTGSTATRRWPARRTRPAFGEPYVPRHRGGVPNPPGAANRSAKGTLGGAPVVDALTLPRPYLLCLPYIACRTVWRARLLTGDILSSHE